MTQLLPFFPWKEESLQGEEVKIPSYLLDEEEDSRKLLKDTGTLFYDVWNPGKGRNDMAALVIFSCALFFNVILLLPFVVFKAVRIVPANTFIAALAISNSLFCSHLLLFNVILEKFPTPGAMCDFIVYSGVVLATATNISRCAIAVDRYIFISDPLRYYQRIRGIFRSFWFLGSFVFSLVIIVSPYAVNLRSFDNQEKCLPPYPDIYVPVITVLVAGIPGAILCIIYTQIFYWAFIQMQILRQEANQFVGMGGPNGMPHDSITSHDLRLYTSAAMLLTPSSPFASKRPSVQRKSVSSLSSGENIDEATFDTSVHTIVRMLAWLKELYREEATVRSTGVDALSQTGNKSDCVDKTHNSVPDSLYSTIDIEEGGHIEACLGLDLVDANCSSSGSRKGDSAYQTPRNVGGTRIDRDGSSISHLSLWTEESMSHAGSLPPEDIKVVQAAAPRGYVPTTPQGLWMQQLLEDKYDVDVLRASDISSVSQALVRRLYCAEIKAAAMIMALMGVFLFCWTPYFVVEIINIMEPGSIEEKYRLITIVLVAINCLLDPFTYALMNPPFRSNVSKCVSALLRRYYLRGDDTFAGLNSNKQKKLAFKFVMKPKRLKSKDNIKPLKSPGGLSGPIMPMQRTSTSV